MDGSADPRAAGDAAELAVSVVVTVRNEERRLPGLLAALGRQTLPRERFELVIVDDASRDGTLALARRHPGARVVALPAHLGLPAGRNAGIRRARAPVVALTDADCIPHDDWLERGVTALAESGADILAGGISLPLDSGSPLAAIVDASVYMNQDAYVRMGFGAGANLWFRRELFERVGFFNELLGMYGDEAELCQRAVASGARLLYDRNVAVVHPLRTRFADVIRKSFMQGFGLAAHRRFGSGQLHGTDRLFLCWRSWVPGRRVTGRERLLAQSFVPTTLQLVGMYLAQYATVRLPLLVGDLAGEVLHSRTAAALPERAAADAARGHRIP